MVIIFVLYVLLVWLLFSKVKLVKWGWTSGAITFVIGAFILAIFMGLFNSLTPGGRSWYWTDSNCTCVSCRRNSACAPVDASLRKLAPLLALMAIRPSSQFRVIMIGRNCGSECRGARGRMPIT